MCSLHVSGKKSPIIRSYRTVHIQIWQWFPVMEISLHSYIKHVYKLIGTEYYNLTYHVYTKYIGVWLRNSMTCSVYITRWSGIMSRLNKHYMSYYSATIHLYTWYIHDKLSYNTLFLLTYILV